MGIKVDFEELFGTAGVQGPKGPDTIMRLTPYFIKFLKTSGRFDAWVEETTGAIAS